MTQITRLFDFAYHQLENFPIADALTTKKDGVWHKTSSQEYVNKANAISRALVKMGVQKNDKIAIISSSNRTEWHIMDVGILQVGAQDVPIYPTISETDYEYILNHCGAQYCFVSDQVVLDKIKKIKKNVPFLKEVYSFDQIEGCKNWSELLELGKSTDNQDVVEDRKASVGNVDLATIIYTSGTTGRPKGVMLSHNNIVSNVLDSAERCPFGNGNFRAISFLPICHIYERMVTYIYQFTSTAIYFGESLEKVGENIKEVKPNVMTGVPRLIEKVYEKIIAKGTALTGIKKSLFFWAVEIGNKYEPYGANGWWYEKKLALARKLIFSKWKEGLGGNLELIMSGSAALQPRLARIFTAANINIMEGYGLSETSPVISVNDMRNGGFRIGTVGRIIRNVEVKIAEDGEILCKGPNVMMGYYKDETQTAEVLRDGFFHTGDIGVIDADGFLKITDRKKEMFKTSGGKYIAPQMLENAIKQSRFVEQAMVIGDGQKMPAAFIQPNFDFIREWATIHKINVGSTNAEIAENVEVKNRIDIEIETSNKNFGNWEQIKRTELTPDIWSIENGHLTPTMKLKRKAVMAMYQNLFDKIYNS
jgi:long-chain acyl-CoA synthetase